MDIPADQLKIEAVDPPGFVRGGQQVGCVNRGVRVTHLPTDTVVEVHFRRSQWQNRETCLEMIEWALASR